MIFLYNLKNWLFDSKFSSFQEIIMEMQFKQRINMEEKILGKSNLMHDLVDKKSPIDNF